MKTSMDFATVNKISLSLLNITAQNLLKSPSQPIINRENPYPSLKISSSSEKITLEDTRKLHGFILRNHFDINKPMPHEKLQIRSSIEAQFNFLITSYIRNNRSRDALKIYFQLRKIGGYLDNFSIPTILKACGQIMNIKAGEEIHGFVLKAGLDWDVYINNSLLQMYTECVSVDSARRLFDEMYERDVVSWSTLIRGYSKNRLFNNALDLIKEMNLEGVNLGNLGNLGLVNMINLFTEIVALKAGKELHAYIIKNTDCRSLCISVTAALLNMYSKCGNLRSALLIFDRMSERNIVSWTIVIGCYFHFRNMKEGMNLFYEMQEENIFPNEITMKCLILECAFTESLEYGRWVHVYLMKNGFRMTVSLATALVDMYGKCGEVHSARILFDRMVQRDVMSWTVMISGYVKAKCLNEAFNLFVKMRDHNIEPNQVTMSNLLLLCAEFGALHLGKWIHAYIDKVGLKPDIVLATSLVDMYSKSGDLQGANQIFEETKDRDVCMWNAMMGGFSMHGHGKEALNLFFQLEREGIRPNEITFIQVLHGCSHAGLVQDGHMIFERMSSVYGLSPKVEHYGCMVDLLGRAGLLEDAYAMIKAMPIEPNVAVWGALLAACRLHKNLELGEITAREILKLDPMNCGYTVLMSNIYAAANKWNNVSEVRKTLKDSGIRKPPGFSSIELNGMIYEFLTGDESHPKRKEIHEMLKEMNMRLKHAGYVANTSSVILNVEDEEKENLLTFHSEKLAMAFGLIFSKPGTPIRIVKNLRVCDDCHSATKLLSKIYDREIIVRDRKRFHRFYAGSCSCGDYW